jgi:LysR family glycine cleavage system transcriptional activator
MRSQLTGDIDVTEKESRAYYDAHRAEYEVEEVELALIVDRTRPFAWDRWAEEVGLDRPEPKQVIEFDTMPAVVRAAERGLGVALVPAVLCDSWMRSGALVRVFAVQLPTADSYYLVSRLKDADKPQVKALTRWALAEYQRG